MTILKQFREQDVVIDWYGIQKGSVSSFPGASVGLYSGLQPPWISISSLLRAMGYGILHGLFPLQQNLVNHFGEIIIHLQTSPCFYKLSLALELGYRGDKSTMVLLIELSPIQQQEDRCQHMKRSTIGLLLEICIGEI